MGGVWYPAYRSFSLHTPADKRGQDTSAKGETWLRYTRLVLVPP